MKKHKYDLIKLTNNTPIEKIEEAMRKMYARLTPKEKAKLRRMQEDVRQLRIAHGWINP